MHDLGVLAGDYSSEAKAINDSSQIVGQCNDRELASSEATLWQDGTPQNLNYCVTLPRDWHLDDAIAINNRGQILARGHCKNETHFSS